MAERKATKNPREGGRSIRRTGPERRLSGLEHTRAVSDTGEPLLQASTVPPQLSRPQTEGALCTGRTTSSDARPATVRSESATEAGLPPEQSFYTMAGVAQLFWASERTVWRRVKSGTVGKTSVTGRLARISAAELARLPSRGPSKDISSGRNSDSLHPEPELG